MAKAVSTDILTDWLTVEQAAVVAGVPVATVLAWIREGRVEVFYVARERKTVH